MYVCILSSSGLTKLKWLASYLCGIQGDIANTNIGYRNSTILETVK